MLSFRDCTREISPILPGPDTSPEESEAYYRQFIDCAIGIDPDYPDPFSP